MVLLAEEFVLISIKSGNILESKADAIVNTVNTKGVMGKGIALQFKEVFPMMFVDYKKACRSGIVMIGKMYVWHNNAIFGPKYIINFPTKNDWKNPSRMEYIEKGLVDLEKTIVELGISSIAIPPLGCGNGGLDWNIVKSKIIHSLSKFNNLNIEIYEPSGAPEIISKAPGKTIKMTFSRAIILKLFKRYCILGYELTLLEVQKLCFFLQEFGEPLHLKYEKGEYGPYADQIRHVLNIFEGYYTQGFRDGSRNKPDTIINLLPNAIVESENFIKNSFDSHQSLNRLQKVQEFIEGFETPFGMELLSTVFWVIKNNHIDINDRPAIINAVLSWNSRKAKIMKPLFVNKAIDRIEKFQLSI